MEKDKLWLDATSNAMRGRGVRRQIRNQLTEKFRKDLSGILDRMKKVPSFLTLEVGAYSGLLREAKSCYELGKYYSTVAMVGIAAERFSIELSEKINFQVNDRTISERKLFGRELDQAPRLKLLRKSNIITSEVFEKLDTIRKTRNKYIHPREGSDGKRDSLKVLKLFIKVINSRFSDKYKIQNGKIVGR